MTTTALATHTAPAPSLRVIQGGASRSARTTWWERRAFLRQVVGGCPDHWWTPAARRTAACTCDRFGS